MSRRCSSETETWPVNSTVSATYISIWEFTFFPLPVSVVILRMWDARLVVAELWRVWLEWGRWRYDWWHYCWRFTISRLIMDCFIVLWCLVKAGSESGLSGTGNISKWEIDVREDVSTKRARWNGESLLVNQCTVLFSQIAKRLCWITKVAKGCFVCFRISLATKDDEVDDSCERRTRPNLMWCDKKLSAKLHSGTWENEVL